MGFAEGRVAAHDGRSRQLVPFAEAWFAGSSSGTPHTLVQQSRPDDTTLTAPVRAGGTQNRPAITGRAIRNCEKQISDICQLL